MATGDQAEKTPFGKITNFKDTFRREYIVVYMHAAGFFVCGTGMTLDFKRRKCGFAAAVHEIVYAVMTLYQQKRYSEYLIVSLIITSIINLKLRVRSIDPIPEKEYIQSFQEILQEVF